MARSPDDPNAPENLDRDSLPWQPSSAPLAVEDAQESPNSPEEAIGGGSHHGSKAASSAPDRARAIKTALQESARVRDALTDAIVAQPLMAVGIAAALGFMAAALLRR
jgi:ElaB/YqjD/DUF883 family membrane-anchored ribosome-binding protein